jgi:hypothetical protein
MAGLKPTLALEVELSGLGNGWTDISADVLRSPDLVIRIGIQGSSPFDRVASTGTLSFALDNSIGNSGAKLGYYSPHHADVRSGWKIGIGIRVRLTDPTTAGVTTRFIGRIDSIAPLPGIRLERRVHVTAVDWIDEVARWRITPKVDINLMNVGWEEAYDALVSAGMPESRDLVVSSQIDVGMELPYIFDTSSLTSTALSEFVKLAHSEGGLIYVDGNGTTRWMNRHARLSLTTVNWTLTHADFYGLDMPSSRDDIINTVRVTVHPKTVQEIDDLSVVVYQLPHGTSIALATGETKSWLGTFTDPSSGLPTGVRDLEIPLIGGTHYLANTGASGSGTDVSASVSVTMTTGNFGAKFTAVNSSGAPAYIWVLAVLGRLVRNYGEITKEVQDSTSVTNFGELVGDFDMPYNGSESVADGVGAYFLAHYKDPFEQAQRIRVFGDTTALVTQILGRDISSRIAVSETVTGLNEEFFINGIELRILPSGHIAAEYILTPTLDNTFFIIGTSALNGADILAYF